jgi:membrane associated rhomboid family serine protease
VVGVTAAFVLVFAVDELAGLHLTRGWALMPSALMRAFETLRTDPGSGEAWWGVATVWTSVLVHANLPHLVSNVMFFWFFGTLLAHVAGERWVLIGLAVTSLSSGLAFVVHSAGPGAVIGASGAISGVAGLYCLLAFRWDVPDARAWPLARPIPPVQAALVALVAVGFDLYVLRSGLADGVARDAHIGGFAGGLVLGAVLTTFFPTWEGFRRSRIGPKLRSAP